MVQILLAPTIQDVGFQQMRWHHLKIDEIAVHLERVKTEFLPQTRTLEIRLGDAFYAGDDCNETN